MRLSLVVLAGIVAALVVALVPGGSDGATGKAVSVRLDEGALVPDRTTVRPGRVTFETANEGRTEHELIIVRTDLAPDALPMGLAGPAVKLAGEVVLGTPHSHDAHDQKRARSRHIPPGGTRRETVSLEPGNYVLLCTLPGHYESGQRAALKVG